MRDNRVTGLIKHLEDPNLYLQWDRLSKSDVKAIEGEIAQIQNSFEYAARNYFFIVDKKGQDVLLSLWPSQEIILDQMNHLKSRGRAQRIQIIKARQIGASRLIESLGAWRTMFFPNQTGLVVADVDSRSTYLFSIMLHIYENLPWWLKPMVRTKKYEEGLHFANPDTKTVGGQIGLNSKVIVCSAKDTSGVGTGFTLSFCHACLAPSALVQTADGFLKPIIEVQSGDRVLTSKGRMTSVKGVFKSHRGTEITTEIKPWGNPVALVTTRDHEILTPNGYKQASTIHVGDSVRFPVRPISEEIQSVSYDHPKCGGRYTSPALRPQTIINLPCDYNLGWLMGLYLAEGSIQRRSIAMGGAPAGLVFAVDRDEAERTRAAIVNVFGEGKYKIYRHQSRTSVVRLPKVGLGNWVKENFGETDTKRIPDWVWTAGREFCRGIVSGYLSGDGHISPRESKVCATSTRLQIPVQIRNLVASLGYGWSGIAYKEGGLLYGRNCKPSWVWQAVGSTNLALRKDLGWGAEVKAEKQEQNHWRYAENGQFVDVDVAEVRDGISPEFYDLEVDAPEHNFTTFQCCVKNSEYALWHEEKAKEIITGQMRYALVESPDTIGVLESTANGARRFAHKLWTANLSLGDLADWLPVFIPCFFEKSYVLAPEVGWRPERDELDLRDKVARDWMVCAKCGAYRQQVPHKGILPGTPCNRCTSGILEVMQLTDPQLCKIWHMRINAVQQGEDALKSVRSNMCTSAEEAFQNSGNQVFPDQCHTFVAKCVQKPIAVGFFDDHQRFHGVKSFLGDPPTYPCFRDECHLDHRFDGWDLKIWEFPIADQKYVAGVDVAAGLGGDRDYSTIVVNKVGKFGTPDVQVLSFRNNTIDPRAFAGVCHAVGKMYNEAMLSIEYNLPECANYVTQFYQYPNLYQYTFLDAATNSRSNRLHFDTNMKNKKRLWTNATSFLKQRLWIVRDEIIAEEMKVYVETEPGTEKVGAAKDEHDDLLTAGMIALLTAHETDVMSGESGMTIPMGRPADPEGDFAYSCAKCGHEWSGVAHNQYIRCVTCQSAYIAVKRKVSDSNTVKFDWDEKTTEYAPPERMKLPDVWRDNSHNLTAEAGDL